MMFIQDEEPTERHGTPVLPPPEPSNDYPTDEYPPDYEVGAPTSPYSPPRPSRCSAWCGWCGACD